MRLLSMRVRRGISGATGRLHAARRSARAAEDYLCVLSVRPRTIYAMPECNCPTFPPPKPPPIEWLLLGDGLIFQPRSCRFHVLRGQNSRPPGETAPSCGCRLFGASKTTHANLYPPRCRRGTSKTVFLLLELDADTPLFTDAGTS